MLGFSTKIISLLPVFYPCTDVEKPDAPHTKQAIICALEKAGINWKNSLVNFTADGAAVNFGCRTGVLKLLQNDLNHLIGIQLQWSQIRIGTKGCCKANTIHKYSGGDTTVTLQILSQLCKYVEWLTRSRKSFECVYTCIETT